MSESRQNLTKKRANLREEFSFIQKHVMDYLFLFLLSGSIIGLDQWTKILVRNNIPLGADWLPEWLSWLYPIARIRHWHNSGAAFGFFQNGNLVFTIFAVVVVCLILYYFPRTEKNDWLLRIAMSMQFAGAIGNLLDRLAYKRVTDFLSFGNFAIFNIADASITVGVGILLLGVWLKEKAEKKSIQPRPSTGDETKSG